MAARVDWKYALSLELDDPGFDDSVLAEFRARLVGNDLSRLAFDRLLERCRELGLVKAGGKQRTDSTHVIAAVRDLNTMELAGEAVRALVEALATVAPVVPGRDGGHRGVDHPIWSAGLGLASVAHRGRARCTDAAIRPRRAHAAGRDLPAAGAVGLAARTAPDRDPVHSAGLPQRAERARREHGITMVTPLLGDSCRQAKTGNGYGRDDFTIDFDARTATYPQGHKSATCNQRLQDGIEKIYITFPQRACWTCDAQPQCTSSKVRRRGLTVYPRELHQIQQAARSAQGTKHWQTGYQRRAGIEGTMNQAANTIGLRKARYRGI